MWRCEVYMIQHNKTGKMYIGRSKDVNKRIYAHLSNLKRGKHSVEDMQEDFDKYGEDYTVSILGHDATGSLEMEMMDKYNSTERGIGYNYKDPHVTTAIRNKSKPRSTRALLIELIDTLTENQRLYLYTFASKMFGG